jgi:hypothetical protein
VTRATTLLDAPVGDGLIVFDPARVRAHGLNASAALVWRSTRAAARAAGREDPRGFAFDADQIVREVLTIVRDGRGDHPTREAEAAPPSTGADVEAQVHEVLEHLEREGLIGASATLDDPAPRDVTAAGFPNVPFTDEPAPSFAGVTWAHRSGPYRGVDVTFRVSCDDAELGAFLERALAPLRIPADEVDDAHVLRYEVLAGTDAFEPLGLIVLDDHVVARPGRGRSAAALVLWHVNQLVSETSSRWMIHASAIVPQGSTSRRAVVFPAHRNAGKSTLVAGLVVAGHEYITDEAVAIDTSTSMVVPYPKAITLERGSWPLLPQLEPPATAGSSVFGHDRWYCDIEALGVGHAARARAEVGAIVFPAYAPNRPSALTTLPPLEAAVALAQNSFNLARLGADGLHTLAHLAERTPCFRLSTGDLAGAIDALAPVLTGPTTR